MKRIEILLFLLAMIFAGCEKIKNQFNGVQGGIKSNVTKILDSKSDSVDTGTTHSAQAIADTSPVGLYNLPMVNNPHSTGNQYPQYSPLRLDTARGIGNLQYPYQWNCLSKPFWSSDLLNFSDSSPLLSDLYVRSN